MWFTLRPGARTADEAIEELVRLLDEPLGADKAELAGAAVRAREAQAPTFLGYETALPHARLSVPGPGLLAFGRYDAGVAWGVDGERARLVFLTLVPADATGAYLEFVRDLGRSMRDDAVRTELLLAPDEPSIRSWFRGHLSVG